MGKTKLEQMQDLLGKDAIATIFLAKEKNLPLYSDDLGLRLVARNDWQVSGFWTQTLLLDFRARGLITEDQYRNAVKLLLIANYRFVSIDGAGLLWVLNETGFTPTPAVTRVFESLHGPECTDELVVAVLSELLKRLWLQPMLYEQKLLLLDLVLNTLTTGRDPARILGRFKIALKGQFALISHVLRPSFRGLIYGLNKEILVDHSPLICTNRELGPESDSISVDLRGVALKSCYRTSGSPR